LFLLTQTTKALAFKNKIMRVALEQAILFFNFVSLCWQKQERVADRLALIFGYFSSKEK